MIYILIILWSSGSPAGGTDSKNGLSVEFNDMESCRAAAAVIVKSTKPNLAYCFAKGKNQ